MARYKKIYIYCTVFKDYIMNDSTNWIRVHKAMEIIGYRNYQYFYSLRKGFHKSGTNAIYGKPQLTEGQDWKKEGRTVMYNEKSIRNIAKNRSKRGCKKRTYFIGNKDAMRILDRSETSLKHYRNGSRAKNIKPRLIKGVDWNNIGGKVIYNSNSITNLKMQLSNG